MATTYLALAKHSNGSSFRIEDVSVGAVAYFPSGAGGCVRCECVESRSDQALFVSKNINWPMEFLIEFDQKDFTLTDFEALNIALQAFNGFKHHPNRAQRRIVNDAVKLGYVTSQSYTQKAWSDAGIKAYQTLKSMS